FTQGLGTLGFECTLEEVDLEDITKNQFNTIKACISEASETGNCEVLEKADFDETKCLKGISEDLKLYKGEFRSFSNQKILDAIDQMMQALNINSVSVPQPASNTGSPSFKDRLRLCSVLQAFLIRAMTINRMINYLNSLGKLISTES
ncbi:PREDICTED: interleukin-12 subunit alpha, partial [Gavialis gangeticus]|uniref:interleukin-12 subunit alpha n=1 Tax=Gavialis gangeticus TaxID=94835 RepID=UPI00092F70DD